MYTWVRNWNGCGSDPQSVVNLLFVYMKKIKYQFIIGAKEPLNLGINSIFIRCKK